MYTIFEQIGGKIEDSGSRIAGIVVNTREFPTQEKLQPQTFLNNLSDESGDPSSTATYNSYEQPTEKSGDGELRGRNDP